MLKKMMLVATGLSLSFAVHTANYFFYNDGRPEDTKRTHNFIKAAEKANDKTLDYLFPHVELPNIDLPQSTPDYGLAVPANMTYNREEFQKFKGTYLEQTADAGADYLKGIVFCGDSLTNAMGCYGPYLKNYQVVAAGNLGVYDFLEFNGECYNHSEEKKTPLQWFAELKPSVLYIMLGTNGVSLMSLDYHIKKYNDMLDGIRTVLPDAKIVLVAIPGYAAHRDTVDFNGKKVDSFNMMLLETAKKRGMYFLNFGDATRDNKGNIRPELCTEDGVHWTNACMALYVNYVRTHALP